MMRMRNNLVGGQVGKPVLNDPANLGGMIAQWKSDSLGLADTNPVSSWADSTGNGKTATQGTGALQPLFRTNQFNTTPAVQFDGTDDVMQFTAVPNLITHSVLAVFKGVAGGAIRQLLFSSVTVGAGRIQLDHSANLIRLDDPSGSPNQNSGAVTADMATTAILMSITVQSSGAYAFFENKVAKNTGAWTGAVAFAYDRMGLITLGAGSFLLGEICIYNKALSGTDIADIYDAYFKPKFGLP